MNQELEKCQHKANRAVSAEVKRMRVSLKFTTSFDLAMVKTVDDHKAQKLELWASGNVLRPATAQWAIAVKIKPTSEIEKERNILVNRNGSTGPNIDLSVFSA